MGLYSTFLPHHTRFHRVHIDLKLTFTVKLSLMFTQNSFPKSDKFHNFSITQQKEVFANL